MDILQEYKDKYEKSVAPSPRIGGNEEQGTVFKLFFKLTGGRVKDMQTANYILIAFSILILVLTVITLFIGGIL